MPVFRIQDRPFSRRKRQPREQQKYSRGFAVLILFGLADFFHGAEMDSFPDRACNIAHGACLPLLFISERIFFIRAFHGGGLPVPVFFGNPSAVRFFKDGRQSPACGDGNFHIRVFPAAHEKQRALEKQAVRFADK